MARVGILGGSFNPPHVGHLVMAQEAGDQLGLDRVALMPVHTPPHKELDGDPGPAARAELCRLAAGEDPRLGVSTREVDRPGPSFTVGTLRAIRDEQPDDELVFLLGADMALSFGRWREPAAILGLATLAVADRDGTGRAQITAAVASVATPGDRLRFFDMPRLDISSSDVRRRVGAGRPIRHLVPEPVVRYIDGHGLYRQG